MVQDAELPPPARNSIPRLSGWFCNRLNALILLIDRVTVLYFVTTPSPHISITWTAFQASKAHYPVIGRHYAGVWGLFQSLQSQFKNNWNRVFPGQVTINS